MPLDGHTLLQIWVVGTIVIAAGWIIIGRAGGNVPSGIWRPIVFSAVVWPFYLIIGVFIVIPIWLISHVFDSKKTTPPES
jgi:hypothetical protein